MADDWDQFAVVSPTDALDALTQSGITVTSGFRTQADNERLASEGYHPARDSHHLDGDAVDLTPGKSGLSMAQLEAKAREMFGANARYLNEGDHLHVTVPGWGGAPDTYRDDPWTEFETIKPAPKQDTASGDQPATFELNDDQRKQVLDYLPSAKSADDLRSFVQQISGGKGTIGNAEAVLDNYRQGHRDFSFVPGSMPDQEGPSFGHTITEAAKSFGRGVVEGVAGIGDIVLDPILQTPERIADLYHDFTGHPEVRADQHGGVLTNAANEATDAVIGAPDPQSTVERYTNAAARMAGNFAVPFGAAGKEGAVRAAVGDLIAGATSGVSGEAAHDIAPSIGVDPDTARTVGQLVGGFAGAPVAASVMGERKAVAEAAGARPESEIAPEAGQQPQTPETPPAASQGVPPIDPEMLAKVNGGHAAPREAAMASDTAESVVSPRQRDVLNVNGVNPEPGTAEQRAAAAQAKPEDIVPESPLPVTPEAPTEAARAANINLEKLASSADSPADIEAAMKFTADTFGNFEDARRGVIPWKETNDLANKLGMDVNDLLGRGKGEAWNAERIEGANRLLDASAAKLINLRDAALNGGEAEKAQFVKGLFLHAAVTEQAAGLRAEAGRALNILRKVSKAGLNDHRAIETAVQQLDKGASVDDVIRMVDSLKDDPAALNDFVRNAVKPRLRDKLMFVWINALLSGPKTHIVNMTSNLVTDLMDIPEHAVASALGAPRRLLNKQADSVMMSEIGPRFYGTMRGAADGLAAIKRGFTEEAGGKTDQFRPAITGKAGDLISIPTRLLNAEDEMFKAMARRSEIAGIAVRKARMEGLKGDAMQARINTLMEHPSDDMMQAAADAALYKTFQRPLGKTMQKVSTAIQSAGWPKLFVPFIRTPTNLLKYAIERSPAAPILKEVRDDFVAGGAKRDLAIARMTLGTGIGMLVAHEVAKGNLTGGGPADPSAKKALEANGWQPYSIKAGDTYVSYRRLDPWSTIIGTAADLVELQSAMTEKQQQDMGALLIGATTQNLASKTWLSGLSDFLDAVTDPTSNAKNTITRLAASVTTPTLSSQVTQMLDPVYRDTNDPTYMGSIRKRIESRIPGASTDLIPRRDILGNEQLDNDGPLARLMSPFDTSKAKNDPIAQAIYDSGARFSAPSRKVGGGNLPDKDYDAYQQVSAQYFYSDMSARIAEPDWKDMPKSERAKEIEKIKNRARKDARADLFGI